MLKSFWEFLSSYIPWIACKGSEGENINGPSITDGADVKEQNEDDEAQIVVMVVAPWKELQQVKLCRERIKACQWIMESHANETLI